MINLDDLTDIWDNDGRSIRATWKQVFDLRDRGMVTTSVSEEQSPEKQNSRTNQILPPSTYEDVKAYVNGVYWLLRDKETRRLYFNRRHLNDVSKNKAMVFAKPAEGISSRHEWVDQDGKAPKA